MSSLGVEIAGHALPNRKGVRVPAPTTSHVPAVKGVVWRIVCMTGLEEKRR